MVMDISWSISSNRTYYIHSFTHYYIGTLMSQDITETEEYKYAKRWRRWKMTFKLIGIALVLIVIIGRIVSPVDDRIGPCDDGVQYVHGVPQHC